MPTIAVVGAGRMGLPIIRRFVVAGHDVRAYDAKPEARHDVEAAGAQWAADPTAAVSGVDVLVTVLPGSPELRQLMLGPDGLLRRLPAATVWLDLTSAAPDLGAELAAAAQERDVPYVDAGIGGGPDAAAAGELMFYVGGDDTVVTRIRPYLEVLATPTRIHRMGGAGNGYLTKLLVNALWFTQVIAVGEVMLAAQRAGIRPGYLRDVLLAGPAGSDYLENYLPYLLDGDYLNSFSLDRIVEELASLQRHLARWGLPGDVLSRVTEVHCAALSGSIDGELAAVAELERRAGGRLRDTAGPRTSLRAADAAPSGGLS